MRALFVNLPTQTCGVSEYGRRMFKVLEGSGRVSWRMAEIDTMVSLQFAISMHNPEVIVYNWIDGQGSFLAGAPFPDIKAKQVLIYHDGGFRDEFAAVLFSDPTMAPRPKWHSIGRPIPEWRDTITPNFDYPTIGVHGFRGAQADRVVAQVGQEFQSARIRMLLPFSHYCDPSGAEALGMAERCRQMVKGTGIELEIKHEFMVQRDLLEWLGYNHINCYFRDPAQAWVGVSSAPDCALGTRSLIAVNRCNAFRHLHSLTPSICVEDSSIKEIIGNGPKPLAELYKKWSAENVRNQVDDVVTKL